MVLVRLCVCVCVKLQINYYFMALRLEHLEEKDFFEHVRRNHATKIAVKVVEGGKKIKKKVSNNQKCSVYDLLIFAIDWYIALDNSVVISGCWLVLIWRSSCVCVDPEFPILRITVDFSD